MNNKDTDMEVLLERFFEGITTNEEEQQLYSFFAGDAIPAHLLPYKTLFSYFETGLKAELSEKPDRRTQPQPRTRHFSAKWIFLGSAAAVILALFLLKPLYRHIQPFDPYEGSYLIRNGKCFTDLDSIKPELKAIEKNVLSEQAKAEQQFAHAEQQLQNQHKKILCCFQDERIRKEVQDILESN